MNRCNGQAQAAFKLRRGTEGWGKNSPDPIFFLRVFLGVAVEKTVWFGTGQDAPEVLGRIDIQDFQMG
jgi:hypothetical protein